MDHQPENKSSEVPLELETQMKSSFPYRRMSPEEYVARHSHGIGSFALWRWKYRDSQFAEWLYQVHVHLHDPAKREACRQKFLTPAELEEVRKHERAQTEL